MDSKAKEFERIYHSIMNELDKWDGEESLKQFLTKIVEKRLLVNTSEASKIVERILSGIKDYKEAKTFLRKNPDMVEKVKTGESGKILKNVAETIAQIFKSVKESGNDRER